MYRDILDENLLQSSGPQIGATVHLPTGPDPKHTAKITQEWLRDNSVNVIEWPSQSPDLNLSGEIWKWLCTNLMELERFCKEEWQKLPKNRCAKLASSSKRLEVLLILNMLQQSIEQRLLILMFF